MKPLTSLQAPPIEKPHPARNAVPEGIPTGVVYSYTFAPPSSCNGSDDSAQMLVLVQLTGGPMLLGSLTGVSAREAKIGARVRMVFQAGEGETETICGGHVFEPLRQTASATKPQARPLAASAA
jgi:hypothetical protein